jgi:hypothetical protein
MNFQNGEGLVWVLAKKGSNLDEQSFYENCWNGKWKCNLANPK